MKWLGLALVVSDLLPVLVFMVAYEVFAPGRAGWRSNPMGRQMMTFAAVTAWLLLLGVVGTFTANPAALWLTALATAGHIAFAAVLWWRVALLFAAQRKRPAPMSTPPTE